MSDYANAAFAANDVLRDLRIQSSFGSEQAFWVESKILYGKRDEATRALVRLHERVIEELHKAYRAGVEAGKAQGAQ